MARGRFISESVAKDVRLNSLSVEAELVYLMTIPHLDRDGLIEGDPDVLWGTVCPKRRQFIDRVASFIQEWATAGLITMYDTDEGPVLWFTGFTKNQVGLRYDRETPSTFPPPPGHERSTDGIIVTPPSPKTPEPETPSAPIETPELTPADSIRQNAGELPEASDNCSPHVRAGARPEVQVEVKDQVKDQVEVKAFVAPTAATPTQQQEMFGAVCEAIGWDYNTLSKDDKGQVAQAVGIFQKAQYTVDDIRSFMADVWFNDWRWKDKSQLPTLKQLRQEIGKTRSLVSSAAPSKRKGVDGFREMLAGQGIQI
jgi:hypothetical protein